LNCTEEGKKKALLERCRSDTRAVVHSHPSFHVKSSLLTVAWEVVTWRTFV